MHRATRVRVTLWLTVGAWVMVLPSAQAYIDPGSTTVIFQAVVAGIAAAGTGVAVFWTRIKSVFRRGSGAGAASGAGSASAEAEAERSAGQV